jgi:hypothetical protein
MSRPVIGIVATVVEAEWHEWHAAVLLVPQWFVSKLQAVGALALILDPDQPPDDILPLLDGLVIWSDPEEPTAEGTGLTDGFRAENHGLLATASMSRLPVLHIDAQPDWSARLDEVLFEFVQAASRSGDATYDGR